ncbi:hypothetical protein KY49_736 [Burkholderia sp. MSHR3999]|uniref:hypothetical protein n=1 Tax=Burkholderia sp. MSHR3999 TaxID=1542965 RepID=UPI0005AD1F47|nr:hypothetical protein [Burkholderia sp. MSHR3999]KIP13109.1 hypothetical protein KY49_736 [Burkholderia sp. MSHR3999]
MNADQKLKLSAMRIKFLAAVLLFGLWTALVFLKGVDPHELIFAIGSALVGLGVYHTAVNRGTPTSSSAVADLVAGIQGSVDPELKASDPAPVVVPAPPAATVEQSAAVVIPAAAVQPAPAPTLQ